MTNSFIFLIWLWFKMYKRTILYLRLYVITVKIYVLLKQNVVSFSNFKYTLVVFHPDEKYKLLICYFNLLNLIE